MSKTVKVTYNAGTLQTEITVDGQPFDTSRINGKEIADWAYPFMMRKVKWNGFYDEMVEAFGGDKEFNLIFEGSDEALAELKEAWEDAPVTIISEEESENIVVIEYDEKALTTNITVNGQPFDTSRINGKEIEDWVYPFMMRKVKWDGIFEELTKVVGSEKFAIQFVGSQTALKILSEKAPFSIFFKANKKSTVGENNQDSDNLEAEAFDLYNDGKYEEALLLRKKAAELGNSTAIGNIGIHYFLGNGVEQDYEKAFEYYQKAASMQNPWAQMKVGFMYNNGYGCEMNEKKAFEYFMKSAEQEQSEGQYWVAMCYNNGWGVSVDEAEAMKWFERSANNGYTYSKTKYGQYLYSCQLLEKAEKMWLEAIDEGDSEAMYSLGEMYINNNNDYNNGFKYIKKAYDNGFALAASNLSICYENGWGTEKNYKKAVQILEENLEEHPEYYIQLGKIFYPMMTEYHNYALSAQYFQKAVDNGYIEGYYLLGLCYANGFGVVKNKEKAKDLLKVAMDNGHEDAANQYNSIIKTEGYVNTAKKIGGGILSFLGEVGLNIAQQANQTAYYDDDDDEYY